LKKRKKFKPVRREWTRFRNQRKRNPKFTELLDLYSKTMKALKCQKRNENCQSKKLKIVK